MFFPRQILRILVRAVVEKLTDRQGGQAEALRPELKELLGRISSRHSGDCEIWQQYARLYGDGRSSNPDDNQKVAFDMFGPAQPLSHAARDHKKKIHDCL